MVLGIFSYLFSIVMLSGFGLRLHTLSFLSLSKKSPSGGPFLAVYTADGNTLYNTLVPHLSLCWGCFLHHHHQVFISWSFSFLSLHIIIYTLTIIQSVSANEKDDFNDCNHFIYSMELYFM